jgi:putative hydrolase of the HAD superfamily
MAPVNNPPPHDPDVWLFDLDNTLYPARCNLFAQIDVRIGRYIADLLKMSPEEARVVQKQYWRDHGTSMRGMMTLHGVDPRQYLDYVHDIDYSPVPPAPELERALTALPGRKLIFTAGDVPHAEKVMARLGVAHHFEAIFDIVAGDYWPKPHQQIYDKLVKRHNVDPTRAAFCDDISINLKPAHAMGMRTVWVRTEESVKRAEGTSLDHIHHQTDDLARWLADWVAERTGKRSGTK